MKAFFGAITIAAGTLILPAQGIAQNIGDILRKIQQNSQDSKSSQRLTQIAQEIDSTPVDVNSRSRLSALLQELERLYNELASKDLTVSVYQQWMSKYLDVAVVRIQQAVVGSKDFDDLPANFDAVRKLIATRSGANSAGLTLKLDLVRKTYAEKVAELRVAAGHPQLQAPNRDTKASAPQSTEQVSPAYTDADIEKAWSCVPAAQSISRDFYFQGGECSQPKMSAEEERRLLGVFRAKYLRMTRNGYPDWTLFDEEKKRRDSIAKAQYETKKERDAAALRDRQIKLKSGAVKPESINDALLLYAQRGLEEIMVSPLLSPDSEIYVGAVLIDQQEREGLLRVRMPGTSQPVYAWLRTGPKTVNYAPSLMRIGGGLIVVGRYIGNTKYRTVAREERTAPTIDVLYFGDPQALSSK